MKKHSVSAVWLVLILLVVGLCFRPLGARLGAEENNSDHPAEEPAPKVSGGDAPAKQVLNSMTVARKLDVTTLTKLKKREILLLGAAHDDRDTYMDKVQKVMRALSVPFTPVSRKQLETYDFSEVAALLCNCSELSLSGKAATNIKKFLKKGGYLFTTDWAIDAVVKKVSPGYIKSIGMGGSKMNVPVGPEEKNKNHVFLRNVFPDKGSDLQWVLDGGSKIFKIVKKGKVTVLLASSSGQMLKKYRSDLIAVTWTVGGKNRGYNPKFSGYGAGSDYVKKRSKSGVVLHVISHFDQQSLGFKDLKGNSSMYQLVFNFLVDAKLAKQARMLKKK